MKTELQQQYDEKGYVVVPGAIDSGLAQEMVNHIYWLAQKHPDVRPEALHHHLLVNDPFVHRLVGDQRLLDIVEEFIGSDIALFAAHYIAKKPLEGQAVGWHQDGSYWPLQPMEVITLWVAGTASTIENGCMRIIPDSQNNRLLSYEEMTELDGKDYVLNAGIHPDKIDDTKAVDLELQAGDISIHNPLIIHGSNANKSEQWRVGLTLRYIPTTTRVTKEEGHKCILLRGKAMPDVPNHYAARPKYVAGEHMPFLGCASW